MELVLVPKTKLGKWSVGLIITMPIFFYIGFSFVDFYNSQSGRTILQDIIVRPGVALPMLAGMASGTLAFITGIMSIIKRKERALFVYISTIIGFLLVLFLIAEIIFPH